MEHLKSRPLRTHRQAFAICIALDVWPMAWSYPHA